MKAGRDHLAAFESGTQIVPSNWVTQSTSYSEEIEVQSKTLGAKFSLASGLEKNVVMMMRM